MATKPRLAAREDSVTDDELFGPGAEGGEVPNDVFEESGDGSLDVTYSGNTEHGSPTASAPSTLLPAGLPNFELLDGSSNNSKSSSKTGEIDFRHPASFKTNEKLFSDHDQLNSDESFKSQKTDEIKSILRRPPRQIDRSISAIEKRQSFSKTKGNGIDMHEPVPDFDEDFQNSQQRRLHRKSNSLPDLVTTNQPPALSPRQFPDITETRHQSYENIAKSPDKQNSKEIVEGPSSMPAVVNRPKKIERHISIKEETEEREFNVNDEPSAINKENCSIAATRGSVSDESLINDKRQALKSKSSGYNTGMSLKVMFCVVCMQHFFEGKK